MRNNLCRIYKAQIIILSLFLFLAVSLSLNSQAQVSFTGTYTQNFDGIGTGTTIPSGWSHIGRLGGTPTSWTTSIPTSGTVSAATPGTVNNKLIVATNIFSGSSNTQAYNYADANTSNRSLGTSPTSGAGNILQLILTNKTGSSLSNLQLSYDIRRFANATSAESIPGYQLFVSVNGGSSWTSVAALNPTASTLPNTVGSSSFSLNLPLSAPVAAGGQIRFRWVDDNSANSTLDQRIGLDNIQISSTQTPTTCAVPSSLIASGVSTNTATLTWQTVAGATSYNLRWKLSSASSYTNVNGLTSAIYNLTGLQEATAYDFLVQSVCGSGTSNFAPASTFLTASPTPTCTKATNLNTTNITPTSALLSWTGGLDITYFTIKWKPVSAANFNYQSNIPYQTFQLNGLTPSTNYIFYVQSVCGAVEGSAGIFADLSAPYYFTTVNTISARRTSHQQIGVWPNPAKANHHVELRYNQMDKATAAASVELFDLFGKRISAYTIPMGDGILNARLNLPNALANGIYLLKVTAGKQQFTERLIIQ